MILFILLHFNYLLYADSLKSLIEIDHPVIVSEEKRNIYILITFNALVIKDKTVKHLDLNLSMVLDRSGSMSDKGKIEYSKEAAKYLIDYLAEKDILSIVEYNDKISLLWPSSYIGSKSLIKSHINELYPRGSTNLTGGMIEGITEVKKNLNSNKLNRVLLLSDGLANTGITNPQEIKSFVQEAKIKGIRRSNTIYC